MDDQLKTTPLNHWHRKNKANMANFGGFDMPLWYSSGVKNEHLAVLESAGLFDTSHMACILVRGPDALSLLQLCFTRDIASLNSGRCAYGAILNPNGHVMDDAIVYRFSRSSYMVCVNAGMGRIISDHFFENKGDMAADLDDYSGKLGKIDIQGKNAAKILFPLFENPETVFNALPYFSFKGHFDDTHPFSSQARLIDKTPVLLSRSGYTGEFGFEIFVALDRLEPLWNRILESNNRFSVIPCGLGARDSLRTGAVLPLSHQDIGSWKFINNPWTFALPFTEDKTGFTKDFIGRKALLESGSASYTYPFLGRNLRKIGTGESAMVINSDGKNIGRVLSCATDMAIDWHDRKIVSIASPDLPENFTAKGLSCGFILVDRELEYGSRLILQEKKRKIDVMVVSDVRPDRTARKRLSSFL